MLKGKTSTGFEYELSDGALSDWEVLEELVNIDEGHYSAAVKLLTAVTGEAAGSRETRCLQSSERYSEVSARRTRRKKTAEGCLRTCKHNIGR